MRSNNRTETDDSIFKHFQNILVFKKQNSRDYFALQYAYSQVEKMIPHMSPQIFTNKMFENENKNENESLLIPAVQHVICHRINFKNKIDLRLT